MTKKQYFLIFSLVIVAIIFYFAGITISSTMFLVILLIVWAIIIDSNLSELKSNLERKIDLLKEEITRKEEENEIEDYDKITSYISSVSISFNGTFLTNLMKELGYDPEKDFDYSGYDRGFAFQYVKDLISGLEFINKGKALALL